MRISNSALSSFHYFPIGFKKGKQILDFRCFISRTSYVYKVYLYINIDVEEEVNFIKFLHQSFIAHLGLFVGLFNLWLGY